MQVKFTLKIRASAGTALALIFMGPGLARADASFPQAGVPFFKALQAYKLSTGALTGMGCLSQGAASSLGGLLSGVSAIQAQAVAETNTYMDAVKKPMPGDGKCDGGFAAVAQESENRRQRTLDSLARWKGYGAQLAALSDANLIGANLTFVGGESQAGCLAGAMAGYASLAAATAVLNAKMLAVQESLAGEGARFASYRDRHLKLQANCGAVKPGGDSQSLVTAGSAAEGPSGKSEAGASDVTGTLKEEAAPASVPGIPGFPILPADAAASPGNSDVSGAPNDAPGSGSAKEDQGMPGSFSPRGEIASVRASDSRRNALGVLSPDGTGAAGEAEPQVFPGPRARAPSGSVISREPKEPDKIDLEVSLALNAADLAGAPPAGAEANAGRVLASAARPGSIALVARETSLFEAVSRHYRSSALFRDLR